MPALKKLPAAFYATAAGKEPVREWLVGLGAVDRRKIGQDIATLQFGWPVGMPLCRSLGSGIHEIRSMLSNNRTSRVIFSVVDQKIVLLHGFIKKTRRTTKADLDLAAKRLRDIRS